MHDRSESASVYFDGEIDIDAFAELDRSICASHANADEFVRELLLHRQIHEIIRETQLVANLPPGDFNSPSDETNPAAPSGRVGQTLARHPAAILGGWTAIVVPATIALVWFGGWLAIPTSEQPVRASAFATKKQGSLAQIDRMRRKVGATLTGSVDCRWADEASAPQYGENLSVGTKLSLAEGLAQVTFDCGAKLILTGPCEFRVDSSVLGTLNVGRLSAVVPRQARGFAIRTPCAEIVDLGTEFGVNVDKNGSSEVHVFEGEVVSRNFDPDGLLKQLEVRLLANQAAEYRPGQQDAREFAASESRFIREIAPRLTEAELPAAPRQPGLAVWYAADLLVKTDQAGRVVAWPDILCGDNQTADDALQANRWEQPLLVENAIHGRPAIRFDGKASFLVSTPIATSDDQTVVAVIRPTAMPHRGDVGQLINYNGPPHRDMADPDSTVPGVLQLGPKILADGTLGMNAFVYRGVAVGRVTTPWPIHLGEPMLCIYVYSTTNQQAALYMNGGLQETSSAPLPAAVVSRKVIGRHGYRSRFFTGDVAEVMIYNAALDERALTEINGYVCDKYGIKTRRSVSQK